MQHAAKRPDVRPLIDSLARERWRALERATSAETHGGRLRPNAVRLHLPYDYT